MIRFAILVGFLFLVPFSGTAATDETQRKLFAFFPLPDKFYDDVMDTARANISKAKLEDGSAIAPETPQERAQELLPRQEAVDAINVGVASGMLSACTYDYRHLFVPFSKYHRKVKGYRGKVMAYLVLLHGVAQGQIEQTAKKQELPCGDTTKKALSQYVGYAVEFYAVK